MPLIIFCGFPLSGKSYFAEKLKSHIEEKENKKVIIVSDNSCGLLSEKPLRYQESRTEKELRAKLKSEIQNYINDKDIVILDSLNYIKGYRYELFCIAKSRSTPHCVVYCNTDEVICKNRNDNESDPSLHYANDVFEGLLMRFEAPIASNRWDSPLFELNNNISEDGYNDLFTEISSAILRRNAPNPNKATQNPVKSSANFLQEIEHQTQSIVKAIIDMQKSLPAGTEISVPGSDKEKFMLRRYQTTAELQRSRRQFIASLCRIKHNNSSVSRSDDIAAGNLADSFVIYLNKCS